MSSPGVCTCAHAQPVCEGKRGADVCAVVVAGGVGSRFGDARGKQYLDLCGLPLLCWSLLAFDRAPSVGHVVVVCARERFDEVRSKVLARVTLRNAVTLAPSGHERQDSVRSGLAAVPEGLVLVAVHDAARPLVTEADVEAVAARVRTDSSLAGAICAARVTDTLKQASDGVITATPDRSMFWRAETPQVFRTEALLEAHRAAVREGFAGTDDASLVERRGGRVACVECGHANIKVTLPQDLAIAEVLMQRQLMREGCGIDD